MFGDEPGVHDWEGVAEEEVCEDLDGVPDKVEFVALFEELDEQQDESCDGVDGEWEQFEEYLSVILGCAN